MPRRLQVSLRSALGGEIPEGALNEAAGRAAVRAMRGPSSQWPVETGFSKRVFFVDSVSDRDVTIGNRARYAGYVEAGVPAARTRNSCSDSLRAARRRIITAGEEAAAVPAPTDAARVDERARERLRTGRGSELSQGQRRALAVVVRAHRTRQRSRLAEASRLASVQRSRLGRYAALAARLRG